jgi:uncharacterized protein (TIGR02145 family)
MKTRRFLLAASLALAITFTLSCSPKDGGGGGLTYQGQTYKTVVIGTQTWMAENLNYAVENSKCYDDDPKNCAKYGRLYDWATAMALPPNCNTSLCSNQMQPKHKGICPEGWHIPSEAEWNTLESYVESSSGCNSCAGRLLKARNGWSDYNGAASGNGTDDFGFSALPSGNGNGSSGDWWTTSAEIDFDYDEALCGTRSISFDDDGAIRRGGSSKYGLISVRCVKD